MSALAAHRHGDQPHFTSIRCVVTARRCAVRFQTPDWTEGPAAREWVRSAATWSLPPRPTAILDGPPSGGWLCRVRFRQVSSSQTMLKLLLGATRSGQRGSTQFGTSFPARGMGTTAPAWWKRRYRSRSSQRPTGTGAADPHDLNALNVKAVHPRILIRVSLGPNALAELSSRRGDIHQRIASRAPAWRDSGYGLTPVATPAVLKVLR